MSKMLNCGDVVAGCRHKVEAPTETELLLKVAAHAKEKHGVNEVTPEEPEDLRTEVGWFEANLFCRLSAAEPFKGLGRHSRANVAPHLTPPGRQVERIRDNQIHPRRRAENAGGS